MCRCRQSTDLRRTSRCSSGRKSYSIADSKVGIAFLSAAKIGGPGGEAFHPGALAPHEMQKFTRIEVIGFGAKKRLHAPLQVLTTPRTQAVTLGNHPVIAQRVQHPASCKAKIVSTQECGPATRRTRETECKRCRPAQDTLGGAGCAREKLLRDGVTWRP